MGQEFADARVRQCFDDLDGNVLAEQVGVRRRKVHQAMVRGAAGEPARDLALAFDQHFDGLTDHRFVLLGREFFLHREQHLVAVLLDCVRNVIGKFRGQGSRARRVLEDVALRESQFLHQRDGRFKVLIGLTGVAHDEVAVQLHVGGLVPQLLDALLVAFNGVAAAHRLEHRIAARLRGKMQVARDLG